MKIRTFIEIAEVCRRNYPIDEYGNRWSLAGSFEGSFGGRFPSKEEASFFRLDMPHPQTGKPSYIEAVMTNTTAFWIKAPDEHQEVMILMMYPWRTDENWHTIFCTQTFEDEKEPA